jgi:hypothetical protein
MRNTRVPTLQIPDADHGLVSLDIEHPLFRASGDGFNNPIRSGGVIGRRDHRGSAKGFDCLKNALIVGGYQHLRDLRNLADTLPDVLDHGLAGKRHKRLPWEARGGVACRNDGHNSHGFLTKR